MSYTIMKVLRNFCYGLSLACRRHPQIASNWLKVSFILEKEMATHSSTLAWRIPWREEPGSLQAMWSQRVGHDWVTSLFTFLYFSVLWYLSQLGRWYDILSSGGPYSKGPDRDIDSISLMIPASKGKLGVWGWMPFGMKTTLSLLLWGFLLVFTVTALLSALFFSLLNVFLMCSYDKKFYCVGLWAPQTQAKNKWASLIHLCMWSALQSH